MNMTPEPAASRPAPERRRHAGRRLELSLLAAVAVVGLGAAVILNPLAGPTGTPAATETGSATPVTTAPQDRIVAYYFHTNYRCASCRKIEAYSRTAIETGFAAEMEEGRLVWRVINIEDKGNEHYVKDYQLYTKSLILSDERSGHQERWKNLAKVWELLGNEGEFVEYVQAETRSYLDELP